MPEETQFAQAESPLTPPSKPAKKSKFLIKIIGGLVIIIFICVGITLATRIWDPLWNPFRPEPSEVIEKMKTQMDQLKTFHSRTLFTFTVQEDNKEVFFFSLDSESDLDRSDPQNPKSAGDFYISIYVPDIFGLSAALSGETIKIGEDFYLKLTSFPGLPPEVKFALKEIGIDIDRLKDQWIKVDFKALQEQVTEVIKEDVPPEMRPQFEKMLQEQIQAQQEVIEKIERLIASEKFYVVKKEFPDKQVGNTKVYHYLVALNKEEFKNLILESARIYIDTFLTTMIETSPFQPSPEEIEREKQKALSEMEKDVSQFFTKLGDIEGNIYIGKKDYLLYKVKGEKIIDLAKFEETEKGKIKIDVEINLSNFNQTLKIDAPKEYKTLEEILAPLFSSFFL